MQIGPVEGDGLTDEDLAAGWGFHGEEIMGYRRMVGTRPWGWWVFEQREDPPDDPDAEAIRLAELGELTDEEVAALADRANVAKTRIGTPAEHHGPNYFPDRRAVEVYERVCEARRK